MNLLKLCLLCTIVEEVDAKDIDKNQQLSFIVSMRMNINSVSVDFARKITWRLKNLTKCTYYTNIF